jgi:hypothetical protein
MIHVPRVARLLLIAAFVLAAAIGVSIHVAGTADMVSVDFPVSVVSAGDLPTRTATYRRPRLSNDGGRLIVETTRPSPAGVAVDFKLDPHVKYRLVVRGRAVQGPVSLRLRRSHGPYAYELAPDGERHYTIVGEQDLQVLVFADTAFRYALDEISLEACRGCRTDDDLRTLILTERPDAMNADRATAALALLDWTANRINLDLEGVTGPAASYDIGRRQAYQIDDMFDGLRGAVYCGGAAVYFEKVLKLFDYDAFTLDFGDTRDNLTHTTTVLPLKNESGRGWDYYLFDPTFNWTMVGADGKLLTVEALIEHARRGRADDVQVRSRPLSSRQVYVSPTFGGRCPLVRQSPDGHLVCQFPKCDRVSPGCHFFDFYLDQFGSKLTANGYPTGKLGFLALLAHRVYSVGPSVDPSLRRDFLRRLAALGVPAPDP